MNSLSQARDLYPRVTHIISKQNEAEYRGVPLKYLADAAIKGKTVHEYCSAYLNKVWIPEIIPEYQPYFDAFKKWADQNICEVLATDHRFYDDELKFSGEVDALIIDNERRTVLIDIKTSSKFSRSWPLQLSAYHHLCLKDKRRIDRVINLHIRKHSVSTDESAVCDDYSAVILECVNPASYWKVFESALVCYNYFDIKGGVQ